MAERPGKSHDEAPPAEKRSWLKPAAWGRLVAQHWLTIVLCLVIVLQTALLLAYTARGSAPAPASEAPSPEVALGTFRFEADRSRPGRVVGAEFSLAVALLDQTEQAACDRMQTHKCRVHQAIEQLLRQAHSADFEDPTLSGLKRQLQEQINETLGLRVVAEVIITDLRLKHGEQPAAAPASSEKPSA